MKYLKYVDKNVSSLVGKTFIVTGSTAGIGLEVTKQLAYKEANVIMAVRNLDKAKKVKEDILKELPNAKIEIMRFDQADFSSIDEFAEQIKDLKIDCLILNAGIYHPTNNMITTDGYPLTVGTNYLGPYYLCEKIHNKFENGDIKRVVVTSSVVHRLGNTKHYEKYLVEVKNKPNRVYNVSKKFNYKFAANLKSKYPNLEVVLTHPGLARTNIIKSDSSSFKSWFKFAGDKFLKIAANSAEKSALCTLLSATQPIEKDLTYITPSGPFHYVGMPRTTTRNLDKIKDDELDIASKKILASN